MSKVWYSLSGAYTFWFSMGLEGDFGMGLLALTYDVESVVFFKRGFYFLVFSWPLYGLGDGLVGVNFR